MSIHLLSGSVNFFLYLFNLQKKKEESFDEFRKRFPLWKKRSKLIIYEKQLWFSYQFDLNHFCNFHLKTS